MGIGTILLLVLSASAWLFTLWALLDTEHRRRELKRAGLNGPRRRYANRCVRHELLRLVKHTIIVAMVVATVCDVGQLLAWRSAGIGVVCALLGINSVLDLVDRRRGLRGYLKLKPKIAP